MLPIKDQNTTFYSFQNPKQQCKAHLKSLQAQVKSMIVHSFQFSILLPESNIFSISLWIKLLIFDEAFQILKDPSHNQNCLWGDVEAEDVG